MRGLAGTAAHTRRTALRSIFRALEQERIIFRDPIRGITLTQVENLPVGLHEAQLRGLLDRVDTALDKLVLGLVAVHAITRTELRALLITEVDARTATITIQRSARTRIIYLDEL